jgi:hypothetical protein
MGLDWKYVGGGAWEWGYGVGVGLAAASLVLLAVLAVLSSIPPQLRLQLGSALGASAMQ